MHVPVLLNEAIEYLNPQPGQRFIDATVNGGGHATAILEKVGSDGKVLGIEWDPILAQNLKQKAQNEGIQNLVVVQGNYINLSDYAREQGLVNANGILFDLGMSSWQIIAGERGFTFSKDEPLDMRYGAECQSSNVKCQNYQTAADILNNYNEKELADLIYNYGGERYSRAIAREIIKARREKPIRTTFELVEILKKAVPFRYRMGRIHFATRTFQALRIAVNHELENLKTGLKEAADTVGKGGRIAVISFHSLEDRIVKDFFKESEKTGVLKIITKKPVVAGLIERRQNASSRSAKLRVAEKI